MLLGDPSNPASPSFSAPAPATHRSYIPSLIPPGVDPAKVDSKMFYTYVPNTIKTRKRTTPAQLEILEGVFITDKKPNAPRRKELAKKLKMSPREVQVRALSSPSSSGPLKKLSFHLLLPSLAKRYGSKTGVQRRKSRSRKRTLHLPRPPPRHPSLPPQLPSPLTSLPPRKLPRMSLLIRFLHSPVHPPSPRSSLRRPSRLHAHLRVLHGSLHLSLRPLPTTRLISCNNTMLPPLVLLPNPAPPCMVSVVAPFLFSASFPHKSRRHSRCRLQISRHTCSRSPLHTNITITFPPHSLLLFCHLTCCSTAVRLVRFRDIPMPCPSVALLPLKQITHRPLARPRVYRRRTRRRTCAPPSQRVWICLAYPQVASQTLVVMGRNRTTRHGFILSNRSHGVRTSRIAHQSRPCSMYPTTPTRSTYQLPRCPCQHSPLRRPVPSLSKSNSRMRSCGATQIRLALVRARWLLRQMQGIHLVCRLLCRLRLGCQQVAMSSPNANPLWHPRTPTPNTPLPWRVGYTDARQGPSFHSMARGVTQARRPALGAVPARTFQTSQARGRGSTKTAGEGRAYRQVRC